MLNSFEHQREDEVFVLVCCGKPMRISVSQHSESCLVIPFDSSVIYHIFHYNTNKGANVSISVGASMTVFVCMNECRYRGMQGEP